LGATTAWSPRSKPREGGKKKAAKTAVQRLQPIDAPKLEPETPGNRHQDLIGFLLLRST
jgi:hypothetical protein